ncbi:hypothetical protein [Absidia glauca]|uniref:Uncharacterized protein n=1 Tax=Absidia glauca TaxID=4829 RepID=A0A163IRC1_ABSGL|nr:hypothetical protein [Absidia glauca]
MEYLELFGSYEPEYDHDQDFQEPLVSMRRRPQLLEDMTDDEGLDEESTNILSVTPAPERLTFSSGEELYDYVEDHCRTHGFIVSKCRTRYHEATNSSENLLKSLKTVLQDGLRLRQFTLVMENSGHCHAPVDTLSGHSRACVLDNEQQKIVKEMTESGSGTLEIVSYLQIKYPSQAFRPKTIYNARQKIRRNYLDGRSPFVVSDRIKEVLSMYFA